MAKECHLKIKIKFFWNEQWDSSAIQWLSSNKQHFKNKSPRPAEQYQQPNNKYQAINTGPRRASNNSFRNLR